MTDAKHEYLKNGLKAGLTAKAATIYVALLEAGQPLSPKSLIIKTGLHRQYVYNALHELENHGLIVTSGESRRIKYAAASPDRLFQDAEKKRLDVLDGVKGLMQLYDRSPAGVVEVIRGSAAVIEDEMQCLYEANQGDYLDIVGGAGMHWVKLFGDKIPEWESLRKEKDIKLRYIGAGEDVRHNREESVIENESRAIPHIGDILNVSIRPGSVSFNIYEPEVMTVRVKNPAAVASQRVLFEVLWKVAQ